MQAPPRKVSATELAAGHLAGMQDATASASKDVKHAPTDDQGQVQAASSSKRAGRGARGWVGAVARSCLQRATLPPA